MIRLVALLVIMGIALAIFLIVRAYLISKSEWEIYHEEIGGKTEVWLMRPHCQPYFVGAATRKRSDYTDKMLKLQSIAEDKMNEFNSIQRVLR